MHYSIATITTTVNSMCHTSRRGSEVCRSRSSTCIRLQNDSIMALSKQLPTEPIEGSRPVRGRRVGGAVEGCHGVCVGRAGGIG